ncbi:type I restriction endonuclease subunit R [Providencia vermicola]|uniref:Type I restriction enzyme endonuclease subunit n=1 Tax=Providencia stuartii TaxID=588 RepID=A0ABD5LF69_PROST|nr:type I restriction endonuclease subunit R [Providencia sp. PROV133]ELR5045600.1 type I restriction endonuclease subunit R [Providencia rettgeri]MCR4180048.1 type I restriction endonuclease subunit R [Providencia vermicola]URE77127.1 type I restriction endonuclease subunit R [Providencia stuartii]
MSKMTESDIEKMAIEQLQLLGYKYVYGPDIEPTSINSLRAYNQVILQENVLTALKRLNPHLSEEKCQEALKQVTQINTPDLMNNNLNFHRLLTEGINIEVTKNGHTQGEYIWLVDFSQPDNNEFIVVNQVTIREDRKERRPDVIIYINGLPLVVIELKNATDENATIEGAYKQIKTYQQDIPSLFTYNAFSVISDGLEAKAGTLSADFERFMAWKTDNGMTEAKRTQPQLEVLTQGLLNPVTLLDMIRYFIVFESSKQEDKNGIISIKTVKKMAAYHQYYAVNAAVLSTIRAANVNADSPSAEVALRYQGRNKQHLVQEQKIGDRKAGVVWHTQGSGKSLSMVFYTGKIVLALDNPTVVVITDRNDLDDQLFGTFSSAVQLLRQTPKQADNREELKELLKVGSGGVIFTTIQKFQPDTGSSIYELLSDRSNIVVIADEAHRSQYGFGAKEVDVKNEQGEVVGKRTVYGFAKYMRDALPNATYLGFTGTPIEKTDVNTPAVFGNYVDIYDIAQAVEDGATVPIYYESRLAKVKISEEGKQLIEAFDEEFSEEELTLTQQQRAKWARIEGIIGSKERIKAIAEDLVTHFEERLVANANQGKGMIVAMSRRIAVDLYNEIVALKPEWHSDDLNDGVIKVVMTSSASDGPEISKHHTTKRDRQLLANRMKDEDDKLKLVIVRDMWLTGFDAPSMHTLYIDKPMKGHNLMQAIARVNRVYKDKSGGLVVDYLGIAADLKSALSFYSDAGGKGKPTLDQDEAVTVMQEKLEILQGMLFGFDYREYFTASTSRKLAIILEAEDFILGLDEGKGKIRFLTAVTALSQAFALATPHPIAMESTPEIAFFQAVKARLVKFDNTVGGITSNENIELRVKQTIDQALVTDTVVDVFDAAGIKKPDISILSDEFLMEMQDYQHKNIALETLKKLLADEIKVRTTTSIIQGKKLMEMLSGAIKNYQNKILTAAEVIDELIKLAKDINKVDAEANELKLSPYEYAFYTAVAENDSAKELIGKDKLRELAVVLTEMIRSNVTLDWTIKESARAKIRVIVKRLLNRYGYPPDMSLLATETVLAQAELLSNELLSSE